MSTISCLVVSPPLRARVFFMPLFQDIIKYVTCFLLLFPQSVLPRSQDGIFQQNQMSVSKLCNKYLNGFLFYEIPQYFRDFRGQLSNGSHFSFTLETFLFRQEYEVQLQRTAREVKKNFPLLVFHCFDGRVAAQQTLASLLFSLDCKTVQSLELPFCCMEPCNERLEGN